VVESEEGLCKEEGRDGLKGDWLHGRIAVSLTRLRAENTSKDGGGAVKEEKKGHNYGGKAEKLKKKKNQVWELNKVKNSLEGKGGRRQKKRGRSRGFDFRLRGITAARKSAAS